MNAIKKAIKRNTDGFHITPWFSPSTPAPGGLTVTYRVSRQGVVAGPRQNLIVTGHVYTHQKEIRIIIYFFF